MKEADLQRLLNLAEVFVEVCKGRGMRTHAAWPNNFGGINCMKLSSRACWFEQNRDRYTDQPETKGERMQTCKTTPSAYELRLGRASY